MTDDLYQQQILDHYQEPLNFGKLDNPDQEHEESNASCGDDFTFYVKFNKRIGSDSSMSIKQVSFTGHGCAISTAACSLLTQSIKGKQVAAIPLLDLEFMQALIGVQVSHSRHKCLLLPARALSKILTQANQSLIGKS